jgi:hypothetical protein
MGVDFNTHEKDEACIRNVGTNETDLKKKA